MADLKAQLLRGAKKKESERRSLEQREQEDKALLAERNSAIDEIMGLLAENHDRDKARERVMKHREELTNGDEELDGSIFHDHKGKRIPIKRKTGKLLALAESLEIQIKTHTHSRDLHRALHNHAKTKISILERQLGRLGKQ